MTPVNDVSGKHVGYKHRTNKEKVFQINNTVSVLTKAKSLIDTPEKWYKGDWSNESGECMCTMGAIANALGFDRDDVVRMGYIEAKQHLHDHPSTLALKGVLGINTDMDCRFAQCDENGYSSIAAWNDSDERSHAQVMEAFDEAIAKASEYL